MSWKPFAEAEAELGTRLYRKVSAGALPTYSDGQGQRFVWMQPGAGQTIDDVLWTVLAELRTVRTALERLERQAAESKAASAAAAATSGPPAPTASGSKIISLRTRRPVHDADDLIARAEALRAQLGISERELLRRSGLSDPAFLCKARRGLKRDRAAQLTWAKLADFLASPTSATQAA